MSRKKDLLKNTMIVSSGKIFTQLIAFLLLPVYTFFLSTEDYGYIDLIVVFVAIIIPLVTLQIETAAFRYLIDNRNNNEEKINIISNSIYISIFTGIVFTLIFFIADSILDINNFFVILLYGYSVISQILFLQIARGLGDNIGFTISNVINGLSNILLNIVFIIAVNYGPIGILLSTIISNVISSIFIFSTLKIYRYIKISHVNKITINKLFKYSIPMIPDAISWWIISVSDRLIISSFLGVASNGIYAIANKYSVIFSGLFSIFNISWSESSAIHINDKDRSIFFSDILNQSFKFFFSLSLVVISIMPFIFDFLIGSNFNDSYNYIPILIMAALTNSLVGMYGSILSAMKLTKIIAKTTIVGAILNIIINIALINSIQIYASAISTFISFIAMALQRHFKITESININFEKNIFKKVILLSSISIAIYYININILNIANLLFTISVFILINIKIIRSALSIRI